MQLHILWRIERKLKSHIVQCLGDDDTTVEFDSASYSRASRNSRLGALHRRDVQRGIHHVAGKLDIGAILDGKGLQRNDGQRILHLAVRQRVASCQLHVVGRIILHTQRTTTHQVDIVGVVGIEPSLDMRSIGYIQRHVHSQTVDRGALDDNPGGIAEVSELDQLVDLVVSGQWRVAQDIVEVC